MIPVRFSIRHATLNIQCNVLIVSDCALFDQTTLDYDDSALFSITVSDDSGTLTVDGSDLLLGAPSGFQV